MRETDRRVAVMEEEKEETNRMAEKRDSGAYMYGRKISSANNNHGGAIDLAGTSSSALRITPCSFTRCYSK